MKKKSKKNIESVLEAESVGISTYTPEIALQRKNKGKKERKQIAGHSAHLGMHLAPPAGEFRSSQPGRGGGREPRFAGERVRVGKRRGPLELGEARGI